MEGNAIHTYRRWCIFFICAWWMLLIPLSYNLFDILLSPLRMISGEMAFSDSRAMYLLLIYSLGLGLFSAGIAVLLKVKADPVRLLHLLLTFFLALILFKYGWMKVIRLQFYLPEPNILYTRFGLLSKDIAYWSLMGTSRMYSVTSGIIEVFAAILLLFPRTRLLGFLASFGIFANVLLINLSFDISVKLFSSTLLLFSLLGLYYYRKRLGVLIGKPLQEDSSLAPTGFRYKRVVRAVIVTLLILEGLYPSVVSGSLNDADVPRPEHHGGYAVSGSDRWGKLYMHRQGYLILEDRSERLYDFKVTFQSRNRAIVTDERTGEKWPLSWIGNRIILDAGKADTLDLVKLPYRSLPLMQEAVHPFSDSFH